MTKEVFDQLVEEIRAESLDTLVRKNKKYAAGEDKLHNFKAGAEIGGGTVAQACWGYLVKHLVALRDKIERNDFSDKYDLLEKCKDSINYICFLWCIGNEEGGAGMRDILFRGKRLDNGEWVEGDLVHSAYKIGDTCVGTYGSSLGMQQVDPSTVGQYTGLKDKSGKRIFEGDIIRTRYANTRKNDLIEQVVFHNGRFCSLYKIPGPRNGKNWANLPDGVPHLPQDKTPYMEWCEVIGNIHDNYEFLEGGEEE